MKQTSLNKTIKNNKKFGRKHMLINPDFLKKTRRNSKPLGPPLRNDLPSTLRKQLSPNTCTFRINPKPKRIDRTRKRPSRGGK